MSIFCGTDIIEIHRIEKSFLTSGESFRDKLFTQREIAYCESKKAVKYKSYAVRFAAKEAVSKAFGTGISEGIGWKDIEIINDERGCPNVVLWGNAKKLYEDRKGKSLSVSLSHCENYAVAYVVLETGN
ncbi:MAG: holo-ACP synthase [Clostridia bacterium]|nr:holo-ACP synthase [Clostridia bacterium]